MEPGHVGHCVTKSTGKRVGLDKERRVKTKRMGKVRGSFEKGGEKSDTKGRQNTCLQIGGRRPCLGCGAFGLLHDHCQCGDTTPRPFYPTCARHSLSHLKTNTPFQS